jgi:cysteine desulfurase / selenocysteine lyase
MDIEKIRSDFPILKRKINGKKLVYLDNAATSLKPTQVLEAERCYYENSCANIHRGVHNLSEEASLVYEETHGAVGKFVGAKKEEVIFTKNTTESLNLIAYSMKEGGTLRKGDKIVTSLLEHHSNYLPWKHLEKIGVKLEVVGLDENFEIDYEELEEKSKGAKLVSISGASNTVASVTDLKKVEKIVHENGALLCVDAAQLAPHQKINFDKTNADFMAFSAHKMLGPTGIGCLVGKKKLLEEMEPFLFGGDMVREVSLNSSEWNELPYKFEAGTPHIAGAYGLGAAIEYIEKVDFEKIEKQEKALTDLCLSEIEGIDGVKVFGSEKGKERGSIVLFDTKLNCHDLGILLNEEGIAVRSGMHCAEPLVSKLNAEGLARASFYFYNTEEEVLFFTKKLKETLKKI